MSPLSFSSVEGGVYNVGLSTTRGHHIPFVKTFDLGSRVMPDIHSVKLP